MTAFLVGLLSDRYFFFGRRSHELVSAKRARGATARRFGLEEGLHQID
jgi:hypothetical protein